MINYERLLTVHNSVTIFLCKSSFNRLDSFVNVSSVNPKLSGWLCLKLLFLHFTPESSRETLLLQCTSQPPLFGHKSITDKADRFHNVLRIAQCLCNLHLWVFGFLTTFISVWKTLMDGYFLAASDNCSSKLSMFVVQERAFRIRAGITWQHCYLSAFCINKHAQDLLTNHPMPSYPEGGGGGGSSGAWCQEGVGSTRLRTKLLYFHHAATVLSVYVTCLDGLCL